MNDVKSYDLAKAPNENDKMLPANSRLCGFSAMGPGGIPASLEINERPNRIAINCTSGSKEETRAINCIAGSQAHIGLSTPVRDLISHSIAASTKRAYATDMSHFTASGRSIPTTSEIVAEYLAEMASSHAVATIQRRLAAISKAHRAIDADDPCKAEIVKATMRGIRRAVGIAQREAKPLLREDLFTILERMGDRPKDTRDKALLLIGFAGAFRRSELVGLDVADVEHVRQGVVITLRRSKTDQTRAGRKLGIPFGRTRWCPVKHLADWLDDAGIENGPIFRSIDRHGNIAERHLSGEAVSIIVKQRAEAAGLAPDAYSGHSLRAGLATSAAMAGTSAWKIRRQTGHASDAMLSRYIRDGDMFTDNAAGVVL
ncbi:site-specific integrase [Mesorhizobium sp. CN5-321]|uniref:site-specific integrase n=1 Tax=Mesorhizobium hunchu TaxID=3157708 RepID=UPI0032B741C0